MKFSKIVEFGAVQRNDHLVDIEKCCKMSIAKFYRETLTEMEQLAAKASQNFFKTCANFHEKAKHVFFTKFLMISYNFKRAEDFE